MPTGRARGIGAASIGEAATAIPAATAGQLEGNNEGIARHDAATSSPFWVTSPSAPASRFPFREVSVSHVWSIIPACGPLNA